MRTWLVYVYSLTLQMNGFNVCTHFIYDQGFLPTEASNVPTQDSKGVASNSPINVHIILIIIASILEVGKVNWTDDFYFRQLCGPNCFTIIVKAGIPLQSS